MLKRSIKGEIIKMEDEMEFESKMQRELLNKRNLRESLKHIIDKESRERGYNDSKINNTETY